MGKRARYWGESGNNSSNATFLGEADCRGDTLPPLDEGADMAAAVLMGDMEVILIPIRGLSIILMFDRTID